MRLLNRKLIYLLICVPYALVYSQPKYIIEQNGPLGDRMDNYFDSLAIKGFSGAIWVEKQGEVVLKGGYGYANRENKQLFTDRTISTIGSVTKPFTAMAVLLLQKDGLLKVDDPIHQYIPGLATHLQEITIHQLLLHTSGLGGIMVNNDFAIITKDEFLHRLNRTKVRYAPGVQRKYSNIGYSVLAYIIEEVSGKKFEVFLKEHILQPLGMTKTSYYQFEPSNDSIARGYKGSKPWGTVAEKLTKTNNEFWNLKGNGGLHSTLNDLNLFYRELKNPKIFDASIVDLMMQPHIKCSDQSVTCYQGYSWLVLLRPEETVPVAITHAGGNNIFYTDFWWYIQEDIFIVMITNNSKFPAEDILVPIRKMARD